MNFYKLFRAFLSKKKPFVVVSKDGEIRYTLHESKKKCQSRFKGWKVEKISWNEYILNK